MVLAIRFGLFKSLNTHITHMHEESTEYYHSILSAISYTIDFGTPKPLDTFLTASERGTFLSLNTLNS